MSEGLDPGMRGLGAILEATASEIAWPPTPATADRWEKAPPGALRQRSVRSWRLRAGRRGLAIAFAVLLLAAAGAAAIPGVRDPVLEWLGLRSVKIERVPGALPEPRRRGSLAKADSLGLGQRTTLGTARRKLAFTPVLPAGLGEPLVYYDSYPPGGGLALVYGNGGVVITELEGNLERQFLFKFIRSGTKVDRLRIFGQPGLWIHGELHQYAYADRTGAIRTDSVRTAGAVLLWRRGTLLLRLEGARSKREALRIARSLRAAP